MHYKKCEYCKKEFYADRHQTRYCCVKCKRAAQDKRKKERAEEIDKAVFKKKADNKPHKSNIAEINRMAREAGMSYGKFVAMKYIEEHRNDSAV